MSGYMDRLLRVKEDRGAMANLRSILVESKKHRAWPVLSRLGINIDDSAWPWVAGLFATHPEVALTTNFGSTCRAIMANRDENVGDDNKMTPTERRFQHLLAAERGKELQDRILRMVLLAKAQGVPVNYEKLAADMKYWNDRTRTEWAQAFWGQSESTKDRGMA